MQSRRRSFDVIGAIFLGSLHLRKIHLHTTVEYRKPGDRTRAQQWTADLIFQSVLVMTFHLGRVAWLASCAFLGATASRSSQFDRLIPPEPRHD